jgi:hypothetical protein
MKNFKVAYKPPLFNNLLAANDSIKFIDGFFYALRVHPWLQNSPILFCPERNTGHESRHLTEAISKYPNILPVYQKIEKGNFVVS